MTRPARRLAALLTLAVLIVLGALWTRIGGERAQPAPEVPAGGEMLDELAPEEPSAPRRTEVSTPVPAAAAPEPVLRGRVVEAITGLGVEGALVGGRRALNSAILPELGLGGVPGAVHDDVARTDAQGAFSLARVGEEVERLVAAHFDYAPAAATRPPEGWNLAAPVVIRVERGPHVYGTARTDAGEPAAGVFVRVFGGGWPRGVGAVTDAEGTYRTPAVHPGPIDLVAISSQGQGGFTTERRNAVISAFDLRVDFGPGPEHVTWRGRVLDEQGEAIETGWLELTILSAEARADPSRVQRRTTEFEGGSFELRKLRPAITYGLALRLEGESAPLEVGEMRFEAPGVVERDLLLAGHALLWEGYERTPGRARWDGLASGTVSVAVSAPNRLTAERTLSLREGEVTQARFELRPE